MDCIHLYGTIYAETYFNTKEKIISQLIVLVIVIIIRIYIISKLHIIQI